MKAIKLLATLFIVFSLSSCVTRMTDFTIISTKNIDLSQMAKFKRGDTRVKGEDSKYIVIIIPTGTPSMKQAIDNAIQSVPGCVGLLDGVVYYKWFYIPYVVGKFSYLVEGTPLIDPSLKSSSSNINYLRLDKDGKVLEKKYITNAEFKKITNSYEPSKPLKLITQ